jgi:hypothetical protein
MKVALSLFILLLSSAPVWAQKSAMALCLEKQYSCSQECRARHFQSDPKRPACLTACTSVANKCTAEAEQAARLTRAAPRQ